MKQKNLITVVAAHQLTADTIAKAIGANNKCDGYYVSPPTAPCSRALFALRFHAQR